MVGSDRGGSMKKSATHRKFEKLDRKISSVYNGVASAQITPKQARQQLREIDAELKALKDALTRKGD